MKYCSNCGTPLPDEAGFCGNCGHYVATPNYVNQPQDNSQHWGANSGSQYGANQNQGHPKRGNWVVDNLNSYIGNTSDVKLNWKDLFSDVFKKHTTEEAEDIFICGTSKTTPPLNEVSETWQKPWLYSRVLLGFLLAFISLYVCVFEFDNPNALPGLMIVGAFAIPFSTVILFMEVNAFRNVSIYDVMKFFMVGGCASLVVTLILFELDIIETGLYSFSAAMGVGIIEEVGKLAIVYWFIKRVPSCNFILSGMLVGACVGAGFAAFESAGYAFTILLGSNLDQMLTNIILRGFLSPGGHVVWAAMTGAALVLAKGNAQLSFDVFGKSQFWKIFIIPIILHGLWDAPFWNETLYKVIGLTILAWVIILILVNMGFGQIKDLKAGAETYEEDVDILQPIS